MPAVTIDVVVQLEASDPELQVRLVSLLGRQKGDLVERAEQKLLSRLVAATTTFGYEGHQDAADVELERPLLLWLGLLEVFLVNHVGVLSKRQKAALLGAGDALSFGPIQRCQL